MCMAIGPALPAERGPLGRAWWSVAASPRRLLPAAALLQAVLLASLGHLAVAALAGLAMLALSGLLLGWLPRCSGRSPVQYPVYAGVLLLGSLGLWLPLVGVSGGGLLLLPAWGIAAASLGGHAGWSVARRRLWARLALALHYLMGALLVAALWTA